MGPNAHFMHFFVPVTAYQVIKSEIKTSTGRDSLSKQIQAFYVIHHLFHKKTFQEKDYNEGVPISYSVLSELFKEGKAVNDTLRYLEKKEFIRCVDAQYKPKEKCKKYKLGGSIENESFYMIPLSSSDSPVVGRLEQRSNTKNTFDKQLEILQKELELNQPGNEYLKTKYGLLAENKKANLIRFERRDLSLLAIYYKEFYAVRPDPKSRVYNSLTGLKREFREYIHLRGKAIKLLDIASCQILLSVSLVKKQFNILNPEKRFPADILLYQYYAEQGDLYQLIMENCGIKLSREKFKKKFFQKIFFSKNSARMSEIKKTFIELFPTVFEIITHLKKEKHSDFAISLQRLEAQIMVDDVFKTLYKRGYRVLTLHDAIVCSTDEEVLIARALLRKAFNEFNLSPKFKLE